jgi:basic amino acid/polyamine antiporter, APA family
MNPIPAKENFKREIGVTALTLAILNLTVGTGIFVIPAIVAESLGADAIMAYLVCGVVVFLIALCFAELGSRTTMSGGAYTYVEQAFGPYAGFLANNIYWFGASVLTDAAAANALADTLKYFFPFLDQSLFRVLFFMAIFGGLALLNIRSVKHSVRFIEIAAFGKIIPLVILVIGGVRFISRGNLNWVASPSIEHIGSASLLLFFAFMGFEAPLCNGGEIKNVKRTVPLGVIFGISLVLALYITIQLVTQGVLGANIPAHKDSPLAAVAGIVFGGAGITLIIITTSIAMFSGVAGDILSVPRMLYAGSRDGIMPKVLAKVHPRFFTPYMSILVYAILGFLFAAFGGFKQLAILASASILLIYLGVVLATLKLRKTNAEKTEKTFRAPGGMAIPLAAAGTILWLLSGLQKQELTGIVIFLLIISVIYFLNGLRKRMTFDR